jgi:protein O-GlcNAc transferase
MPDTLSPGILAAARRELAAGRPDTALSLARELLTGAPDDAEALHLSGLIKTCQGRHDEAICFFKRALAIRPDCPAWKNHLAISHAGKGEWGAAAALFVRVLEDDSNDFTALSGYGRALLERGETGAARDYLRQSLFLRPDSVFVLVSLAKALATTGEFEEAAKLLTRASAIAPEKYEPYRLLGRIHAERRASQLARSCWEKVLDLHPDDGEAISELIHCCWGLGDLPATLALSKRLVDDGRANFALHCFWLYARLFDPAETAETMRVSCEDFGRRITPVKTSFFPAPGGDISTRRLRIGYVGSEFHEGAASHFLSPLIGSHEKKEFKVFLYHTGGTFDHRTEWYRQAGNWRDCRQTHDNTLRQYIRRDKIDILVDLSGFLPDNRLKVFASRVAPVQVAFPNCPVTTGLETMDYIFTDRWTCPPGQESQYAEQPVFLPSGYLAYAPPEIAPDITDLPANHNGYVTLGLFQRRAKMNARVWDLIAEVLRRCPGSRLLVQNEDRAMDDPDSVSRGELLREFRERGVPAERLMLVGMRPHAEAMAYMSRADIALDTFPFQGQTTTCECLWLGVPVVALSGSVHVARVGSAILERVGLASLATRTEREYVERAVELAGDLSRLARLRTGMRERLRASTLLDGRNLAREVEEAYRRMWDARSSRTVRTGVTGRMDVVCGT